MEEDTEKIEGWTLDPRQVRLHASKVGLPSEAGVPMVIVSDLAENAQFRLGVDNEPLIVLPESEVKSISDTDYVLGRTSTRSLRHELAHYLEHLEGGLESFGHMESASKDAEKEIRTELRGKTSEAKSFYLFRVMVGIKDAYGLRRVEAMRIVREEALKQGMSKSIITRGENLARIFWRDFPE